MSEDENEEEMVDNESELNTETEDVTDLTNQFDDDDDDIEPTIGTTIADKLAKQHREISIAEFFERNKHLLGFENLQKSLLTCVREAVDNSLDACEDARILPNIYVELKDLGANKFKIIIEDNGPGIVKANVGKVFGKLLYGGKFNLKQSRGQQGIGISASVLYAQLTTGKPTKVYSRINDGKINVYEIHIDTTRNEPDILSENVLMGDGHGVRIELDVKGKYTKGKQGIEEYIKQSAIINPYAKIVFIDPTGKQHEYQRVVETLPPLAKDIKPHPKGIELGLFIRMLKMTKSRNLTGFLTTDFSRIGRGTAVQICTDAGVDPKVSPRTVTRDEAESILDQIALSKLQKPPTDCLSPIGESSMKEGLKKELHPEFLAVVSRPPMVYKGHPFLVEVAMGFGGDIEKEGNAKIIRYANKMPLLYEQSACAITKSIIQMEWKRYSLSQSSGSIPTGPLIISVHLASVWVPYTSEGKEAIASYPPILKELKLALQEAARKLSQYVSKKKKVGLAESRKKTFETYAAELAEVLSGITGHDAETINKNLQKLIVEKIGDTTVSMKGKGIELFNDEDEETSPKDTFGDKPEDDDDEI
ncbi:MAG: DNA topoisomerase VI subunit B [DPANN group archaeon]|nr:DNA topoisomerase VI subunit B [DPANN group archaeon]